MAIHKWHKEAKMRWGKKAAWIQGDGQFALLAHCRELTVSLWATNTEAEKQKKIIDENGCGGYCSKQHQIIDMDAGGPWRLSSDAII